MPHPFTTPKAKGLRERVGTFVQTGLHRTAATNIIFVCGGNEDSHLRPRFMEYMVDEMPSYRPFMPEAAQADYFEQDHTDALNLSAFEELVMIYHLVSYYLLNRLVLTLKWVYFLLWKMPERKL